MVVKPITTGGNERSITMRDGQTVCPDCKRLHIETQPCPHRVAVALVEARGLQELTEADRLLVMELREADFSVTAQIEEYLAEEI